jgi:adenylate cyclase class 2
MKEIEVKILEINPKDIEKKIIALDGKKNASNIVHERFYDFPDGKLKSKFSILRIRTIGKKTEFTFKHSTSKLKEGSGFAVREEIQTEVSDVNELERIVLALGLVVKKNREKKRTSFTLGKTKIEIDEYPGIPAYLEVEGDERSIPPVVRKLGFTMNDTTNISSTKVLKKYGKNPDFIKF